MEAITFINKTTNSTDVFRSTPEERKRINERNREHRAKHRNALEAGTTRSRSNTQLASRETSSPSQAEAASVEFLGELAIAMRFNEAPSLTRRTPLTCPLTGFTIGGLGDPFNTFAVPLTTDDWRLIRFYKDIYYQRLWATVTTILGTALNHFDFLRCSPDVVISECLQIPSRMWSLLASASCNLQHQTTMRDKSLLLVSSGTASLRSDLQNSQLDRHSLLTSIHLYLAAQSLQQQQIAEIHLNGARAILRELTMKGIIIPPPTIGIVALINGSTAAQMLQKEADRHDKG